MPKLAKIEKKEECGISAKKDMKDLYLVVRRKLEEKEDIYSTDDIEKAICAQKALIEHDDLTHEVIEDTMKTISKEEIQEVSENIQSAGRDRLYSEDREVYIIFFPARS